MLDIDFSALTITGVPLKASDVDYTRFYYAKDVRAAIGETLADCKPEVHFSAFLAFCKALQEAGYNSNNIQSSPDGLGNKTIIVSVDLDGVNHIRSDFAKQFGANLDPKKEDWMVVARANNIHCVAHVTGLVGYHGLTYRPVVNKLMRLEQNPDFRCDKGLG